MLRLSPESQKELDSFCEQLSDNEAASLRTAVQRVCADPSGRRQPGHNFTRTFNDPGRYTGKKLPRNVKAWEFKPSRYRALFITDDPFIVFLKVRGKRFRTIDDCPWH